MFINDLFATGGPARGDRELWKSTRIGNRVSIGSNATILPVEICDDVVIGAGAVVTRDITEPGIYAGNPAAAPFGPSLEKRHETIPVRRPARAVPVHQERARLRRSRDVHRRDHAFIGGTPVRRFRAGVRRGLRRRALRLVRATAPMRIYIALRMLGIGAGDEVITTAHALDLDVRDDLAGRRARRSSSTSTNTSRSTRSRSRRGSRRARAPSSPCTCTASRPT